MGQDTSSQRAYTPINKYPGILTQTTTPNVSPITLTNPPPVNQLDRQTTETFFDNQGRKYIVVHHSTNPSPLPQVPPPPFGTLPPSPYATGYPTVAPQIQNPGYPIPSNAAALKTNNPSPLPQVPPPPFGTLPPSPYATNPNPLKTNVLSTNNAQSQSWPQSQPPVYSLRPYPPYIYITDIHTYSMNSEIRLPPHVAYAPLPPAFQIGIVSYSYPQAAQAYRYSQPGVEERASLNLQTQIPPNPNPNPPIPSVQLNPAVPYPDLNPNPPTLSIPYPDLNPNPPTPSIPYPDLNPNPPTPSVSVIPVPPPPIETPVPPLPLQPETPQTYLKPDEDKEISKQTQEEIPVVKKNTKPDKRFNPLPFTKPTVKEFDAHEEL